MRDLLPWRAVRRQGVAATSKLRRMGKLARRGVGTAASGVLHRGRKKLASEARQEELDLERRRHTAAQVTEMLGEMKGLAMKFGQAASYMQPQVPDEWSDALARLQQEAPAMSAAAAARVVKEELGAPPSEIFAEWDPVPIGAASVGQVHRAVTRAGRPVAVKVQYPGAADALGADVDMLSSSVQMLARRARPQPGASTPTIGRSSIVSGFEEFKARMVQETDYLREAANQELIGAAFDGHPLIHVPRVVREHSSARVLTTELAEGARFAEVLAWSQDERDRAGETVFRFHHECFFLVGHHNADPHPGNYVFRPGGEVTFLDFGAIWEAPPAFREGVPRLLEVVAATKVGPPGLRWFRDQVVVQGPRALTLPEPLRMPQPGRPAVAEEDEDKAFMREMAKAVRGNLMALEGVQAVLAALGSVCDWGGIAREIVAKCVADNGRGTL